MYIGACCEEQGTICGTTLQYWRSMVVGQEEIWWSQKKTIIEANTDGVIMYFMLLCYVNADADRRILQWDYYAYIGRKECLFCWWRPSRKEVMPSIMGSMSMLSHY